MATRAEQHRRIGIVLVAALLVGALTVTARAFSRMAAEVESRGLKSIVGDVWNVEGK
jgi:hypothetical protein